MAGALERVDHAAAALRDALASGPAPRWLLLSRFGFSFLEGGTAAARPIEILVRGGSGRLLARRMRFGQVPALAVEHGGDDAPSPFDEALPVLAAGQLGMRGVVLLLAAGGLASFTGAPAIVPIGDWIRTGDADPLRELDASRLGARFPEMRGLAKSVEVAAATALLARQREAALARPAVAVARRGPSGATDAELESYRRLGGDLLVDGCGAEIVAARHQGLSFAALALVLDSVGHDAADPGGLAESASRLLPSLAELVPGLVRELDAAYERSAEPADSSGPPRSPKSPRFKRLKEAR